MSNVLALVLSIISLILCTYMYFTLTHLPLHISLNSRIHKVETFIRTECSPGRTAEEACINYTATKPSTMGKLIGGKLNE